MPCLNEAIIMGHLGRDPEIRYARDTPVLGFSVATSRRWKNKVNGDWEEKTTWHRVQVWGDQAEVLNERIRKGSLVLVKGEIDQREWISKTGEKRVTTEIKAYKVLCLDPKKPTSSSTDDPAPLNDGDIPF